MVTKFYTLKKHFDSALSWVPLQRCICPPELCSQCRAGRSSQHQCTPPGYGRFLVSPRVGAGGQQSQMREPNVGWRDSGVVDWSPTWHGQQSVRIILIFLHFTLFNTSSSLHPHMYLSLMFLTPWGSLLLTHTLPIPPSPPPHKHDSSVTPLPPHPHTPTPSVRGSLVTKELYWRVELTSLPHTHTHTHTHIHLSPLLDILLLISCSSLPLVSSLSTFHHLHHH